MSAALRSSLKKRVDPGAFESKRDGEGTESVGPMRLHVRLLPTRPSLIARARKLSVLCASVALMVSSLAIAGPNHRPSPDVPRIYHKGRNFRIPFNLNAESRERIKEFHLLVSEDQGYHWRRSSKTYPDHPSFSVRTSHDGEYWFAVQTITVDGKYSPKLDDTVEPNMKVIVDTFPPSLILEPDARRGSVASVRWDAKDENLDLNSLILEYQVEGAGSWRKVPIKKPRLIGSQSWDAGTAEALKVQSVRGGQGGKRHRSRHRSARGNCQPAGAVFGLSGRRDPSSVRQGLERRVVRNHRRRRFPAGGRGPGCHQ